MHFLLTERGAVLLWVAYAIAAAIIQFSLSHTLYTDDAMTSLRIQDFGLGYAVRNPPLWEWILLVIQQVTGPGPESHFLLRYACIALLGVAVFKASLAVSSDEKWSAAVTLATPLFYAIGWPYFQSNTYSLIIVIVCLFTIHAAIRYVAKPDFSRAAVFGILIGLGFLSKYNYAIFIASLVLALFIQHASRPALLRREFAVVFCAALIVVSPFVYWLVTAGADLVGLTQNNLVTTEQSHFVRIARGLGRELELAIGFILPWGLVMAGVVWRGRQISQAPMAASGFGERTAGLTLVFSIAITTVGIVLLGVTKLNAAYMFPVMIAAVPWSAAVLSRAAPGTDSAGLVAVIGVSALVVIVLVRLVYLGNSGFPEDSRRQDMLPFADLAREMRDAGFDRGTLVTVSDKEGGNLRAELPQLRVVTINQADNTRPSHRPGHSDHCRLLWNSTDVLYPDAGWARTRQRNVVNALPQVAGREQHNFDILWPATFLGTRRTSRWTIVELDPDDPVCK